MYFASYNEDNRYIASGGEDQRLIIWDTRKGTPLKVIESKQQSREILTYHANRLLQPPGENKIIYNIKWSRDGNYLATSEYGGVCKLYDAKTFELIASFGKAKPEEKVT